MESTASGDHTLSLVRHSELDIPISLKIGSLEGPLPKRSLSELLDSPALKHEGSAQSLPSDVYVVVSLWADNKPLVPAVSTSHRAFKSTTALSLNESVTLALKYRDLPLNAQLAITVYDIASPLERKVIGGSTLRLFGKKHTLKKGKQRLFLWPGAQADGSSETETPSKVGLKDEMGRLEKLVAQHERGDITRMDWLDKLAFRNIERIHAKEAKESTNLFLYVDLPKFDFPVVFSEAEYALPMLASLTSNNILNPSLSSGTSLHSQSADAALFTVVDPEIARENPVEAKHRRLVRSHRNGPLDRELKPNAKIRDELNDILRYPPTQELTAPQRDLVWQFRFYLSRDKRALTKFLKSVVWSDQGEVKQAVETLLPMWAEVDIDDALELLGPGEGFRDRRVRAYAVQQLGKADDDELMLYLLQLVQALKFETPPHSATSSGNTPSGSMRLSRHSSSHRFLPPPVDENLPTLEDFLIERSASNPVLGNHFGWYIAVECEDKQRGKMFAKIAHKFRLKVAELQLPGAGDRLEASRRQAEFIAKISQLAKDLRASKEARPKKVERLRAALSDSRMGLGSFAPIPLPLDARIEIVGIDPDKSSVFKSNLFPLRLHLLTKAGSEHDSYAVIFKNGDDLRQDQLVIQLFTLMDRLLRKENLDLKLMPYRVLATGAVDGMVQFVESKTLQDISNEYGGSLLNYLRAHHPDPGSLGTFGVKPEVLDTYIRSCAGYCVVTYLLGVGDRHLDNLLLSPDGHFFHVDFGYILGRDPKPFPPAVKVCKEMVDCMGGVNSPHYARFKSLCYTGFTTLRKNSSLIINLVALMVDGNIPDISIEPDKAVGKVQDKFLLGGEEDEAVRQFESLLNETSYFNSVLDRIHSVAQYWRA